MRRLWSSDYRHLTECGACGPPVKVRQAAFDSAADMLSMSEAEAYAQKDLNPWLAWLGGTKAGRGYSQLLQWLDSAHPTERDLILRGKRAVVPLENLPPELYQAALDTGSGGIIASQIKSYAKGEDPFKEIVPHQMVFLSLDSMGDQSAGMMGFGGMVSVTGVLPNMPMPEEAMSPFGAGIPMSILPLAGKDSAIGNAFGKMLFALDEGATLQEATASMTQYFGDPNVMAAALGRKSETEANPPTDPALTREIDLQDFPPGNAMMQGLDASHKAEGETIAALSAAFGMPVMMESFHGLMPISAFVPACGPSPAYKSSDRAGKGRLHLGDCGWRDLRVRPEDWDPPLLRDTGQHHHAVCGEASRSRGEFTLADLASIATELPTRRSRQPGLAPALSTALSVTFANPMGSSRELLRFYGTLDTGQRQTLAKEPGLAFAGIRDNQWEHLAMVISDKLGGVQVADGSVWLKPMSEEQAKAMQGMSISMFQMSVLVAGEEKPRSISEMVMVAGKEQIEQIKKMQKDMLKSMGRGAH